MLSADEGAVSIAVGAEACGAGIAGRRADACTANRSAADFVRRYPAVYTARTAAEPSATRPFATFLWDPLSDTALHYSESDAVLCRCHSFAFFNHSEGLRPSDSPTRALARSLTSVCAWRFVRCALSGTGESGCGIVLFMRIRDAAACDPIAKSRALDVE